MPANYSFLDTGSSFANRGLGSVTGRLGYTWGPSLLYVKGGYAWAENQLSASAFGVTLAESHLHRQMELRDDPTIKD